MFTGITQCTGIIRKMQLNADHAICSIHCDFDAVQLGESIAIDGVCLTVTDIKPNEIEVALSKETLNCSFAAQYQVGSIVNLERALTMSDRLGGHFVTGHVDQTIKLARIKSVGEFRELSFCGINKSAQQYLVPKGSVTVNGVSLTINAVSETGFTVMLIPHTLEKTNLGELTQGMSVNVEFDYLAKIVHKQVSVFQEA